MTPSIVIGLLAALAGILAGYGIRTLLGKWQADSMEKEVRQKLKSVDGEIERKLREADIQARAEVVQAREAFEQSTKTRRKELQDFDDKLVMREDNLDRKMKVVEGKEQAASDRAKALDRFEKQLNRRQEELDGKIADADKKLQILAGMTADEARAELKKKVEDDVRAETGALLRRLHEEAKEDAEKNARVIVANAIERYASAHASSSMTSTVFLPSEDLKGRIIGREGRNVRAIEAATGTTLLADGTPEAVVISGFDPVRREIARQALVELVADGRIHPARIEEAVAKATENMDETILQAGREAAYACQQQNVDTEILRHLGRLKFRTSYSQNVLSHSIEVSRLMGAMAGELGLDVNLARRAGLFHDIGKSTSEEEEGGHAKIGGALLARFHEDPVVVNVAAGHHGDVEATSLYTVLCTAADTLSSARPGARNESTDVYVQRLEKLEAIAKARKGVKQVFAIQAGRELRVFVDPDVVNDNEAMLLAQDICRTIEAELRYPGQIRVVVIREQRCLEYAK